MGQCRILSILPPGIWDTLFNFRDTAILPQNIQIQNRNTYNLNKNHLKFSTKEEKLYVHDMASLSRPAHLDRVTCIANALIKYPIAGGCGDSILYIVDSIWIKLFYPWLDFPQTCMVFYVESLNVLWYGHCPFFMSCLL